MEKLKVIIVEDEFVIAEDIRIVLENNGYEVLAVYDRSETALPDLAKMKPDIMLIDIHLAGAKDGIYLAEEVRRMMSIPIIYITANSDPATYERARSTKPHAFLVKPFTQPNLLTATDLALYHFANETTVESIDDPLPTESKASPVTVNGALFIRVNGKFRKVDCEDILFAEASGSYVNIQTVDQRYTLSQNLAQFQRKTPLPNFVRIHRSYIININKVDSFEESFVFIENHKLPLSEKSRAEFLSRVHCL